MSQGFLFVPDFYDIFSHKSRMAVRPFLALLLLVALSACAVNTNPVVRTLSGAFSGAGDIDNVSLNPRYSYLWVVFDGHPLILALGYIEPANDGDIQVWYGADHQVLRLKNGRLFGVVGMVVEWRSVTLPTLPSWSELVYRDQPFEWTRTRDVMPGYRLGVQDMLVLRRIAPPTKSELRKRDTAALIWFEESLSGAVEKLPPARYAVDASDGENKIVYAEQCLSPDVCLSWQKWSAADQSVAPQSGVDK